MATEERNDPYARTLASVGRGTTVMAVSTVALLFFNLIGRVAVARSFSLELWGIFSLGISLTGLLVLIALLGFHQAVARSISYEKDPAVRRKVIRLGLMVTIGASVASSVLVFLLAQPLASLFNAGVYESQLTQVFQLFSITIGLQLLSLYLAAIFQGFEDAAPNAWFNQVINPALFVVFLFLFLALHLEFEGALFAYVISYAATFALLTVYTLRKLPPLLPKVSTTGAKVPAGIFTLSFSLWGVNALTFVTAFVDTLILGVFRPATAVGLYSTAMTLARLLLVGAGALTYVYLPVSARLYREGDTATLRLSYVTATRWVLAITVPMFFLFTFLPAQSIGSVFGARYENAALALALLAVGSLVSVVLGPVNATLAGQGKTSILLSTTAIAASTNIILSFALIPTYGLLGAAVAWTVARVIFPAMGLSTLYASEGVTPFRRKLLLPLGVTLAIGMPLFWYLHWIQVPLWSVYPLYLVGVVLFVGAVFATRSLDEGDLIAARLAEKVLGRPMPRVWRFLDRFVHREPVGTARS